MLLEGKVAIVTGGGSGLGKETCLLFAEHGARVAVADFNYEAAKRVADEINEMYSDPVPPMQNNDSELWQRDYKAIAVHVNVADRTHVDNMVWDVLHMFGRIDILINNAGITRDKTLAKMTQTHWQEVIDTNLTGVFNCAQSVIKQMIDQGFGRIINISSVVRKGNRGQSNYVASKAGVVGLAKTWALEYGHKGINVNAIAPGFMKTNMTDKMPPEILVSFVETVPLKRIGQPRDIANGCLYLASKMGDYVNGTVLEIDGGLNI